MDVYICITESLCCTAEMVTSTALQINSMPITLEKMKSDTNKKTKTTTKKRTFEKQRESFGSFPTTRILKIAIHPTEGLLIVNQWSCDCSGKKIHSETLSVLWADKMNWAMLKLHLTAAFPHRKFDHMEKEGAGRENKKLSSGLQRQIEISYILEVFRRHQGQLAWSISHKCHVRLLLKTSATLWSRHRKG